MTIGDNIRAARDAAGWTQQEAADRAGMKQPNWCDYEHGGRVPSVAVLRRIAKAIGCEVAELIKESRA